MASRRPRRSPAPNPEQTAAPDPKTSKTRSKSSEKRQQILDAAAKALAQNGYSEATLSDIANDIGTHAGSLYYYFPSREDLVREVFITSLNRMSEEFFEAIDKSSHQSALDGVMAFLGLVISRRTKGRDDYMRAYLRNGNQVPESMRDELTAIRARMRRTLANLLKEAQAAGQIPAHLDAELAALFIIGSANWAAVWYEPGGPRTADKVIETFVELLLHGLLGKHDSVPAASTATAKPKAKTRKPRPTPRG
jgi:AcrR family transcriptional regulator